MTVEAKTASALYVPDWVRHELYAGDVAKVLRQSEYRIDYWTRRGKLPHRNGRDRNPGEWHTYDPRDIAAYAEAHGITPNWEALRE